MPQPVFVSKLLNSVASLLYLTKIHDGFAGLPVNVTVSIVSDFVASQLDHLHSQLSIVRTSTARINRPCLNYKHQTSVPQPHASIIRVSTARINRPCLNYKHQSSSPQPHASILMLRANQPFLRPKPAYSTIFCIESCRVLPLWFGSGLFPVSSIPLSFPLP